MEEVGPRVAPSLSVKATEYMYLLGECTIKREEALVRAFGNCTVGEGRNGEREGRGRAVSEKKSSGSQTLEGQRITQRHSCRFLDPSPENQIQ